MRLIGELSWVIAASAAVVCCGGSAPAAGANSGGSAPASTPTDVSPCRGSEIDAARAAKACAHTRPDESAPPADALRVELETPASGIVSGSRAAVIVRYRNASPAPLEFQLNAMCGETYDVRILGADGKRVDIEEEIGGLGLCGTVPGIRIVLEPNGVLTERLEIDARVKRWVPTEKGRDDSPLELAPGAPLRAGSYTLDVALPLYTDHRRGWEAQMHVKAPLTISER